MSRCSARFPRVLGPPLPLAICHLPPLPARVAERKDKGAGATGPAPPAAPLPLPRAAGLRPAAPRAAFPPPGPRAGGRQRRRGDPADGLRSPRAPAQSPVPLPPGPPPLPQPRTGAGEPGGGAGGAGMRARGRPVGQRAHNGRQSQKRLISMLMSAAAW